MARGFTIPTKFTAIDKFTGPVKKMTKATDKFGQKMERGLARAERGVRKFLPSLSDLSKRTKDFIKFTATAAIGVGIGALFALSVKSVMDYENALASAQAITGTTNKEFAVFKAQIEDVAKTTKKSSVEVARGFEIVGSAAPALLKDAEALGEVTKASIILSKASGDDLATSARNLTGVMNQFSLTSGADAIRTMDVLANGSVVGSANITMVGESMKNFGSVAAGANITLEQSVALVEVMGKFSVFGAEAGTKLRGSILKLQKAGLGYASGQFQINDALEEARQKFLKLSDAKKQDAFLNKTFGAENVSTGRILLNNIELFNEYTEGVKKSGTATAQAEVKSDTLSNRLQELKNGWVNMVTGSGKASKGLETLKKVIVFVTENLDTIVSVATKFVLVFGAIKGIMMVARGALMAYNVATKVVTAVQWLWNAAMMANPIGLIIAAVAALAIGVYALAKAFDTSSQAERLNAEVRNRALEASRDQRVEVTMLFAALRNAEVGSNAYNETLKELERIQPGIIEQYNLQAGALEDINRAEKDLTASILKRAEAEARAELIKEKFTEAQKLRDEGPGFFDKVAAFGAATNPFIENFSAEELNEAKAKNLENDAKFLAEQQAQAQLETPKLNPQQASNESIATNINENKETVTVDFKNVPAGAEISGSSGSNFSVPSLGTTN